MMKTSWLLVTFVMYTNVMCLKKLIYAPLYLAICHVTLNALDKNVNKQKHAYLKSQNISARLFLSEQWKEISKRCK